MKNALTTEKSAGKYKPTKTDGVYRPFKPKGGNFKKDRREDKQPIKQQQGGKHIDLKALRNNGDPVRVERAERVERVDRAEGGKKKFGKKPFQKGGRDQDK